MLPQTPAGSLSHSIFINPNFNKAQATHINPDFLVGRPSNIAIHLNPEFLQKTKTTSQQRYIINPATIYPPPSVPLQCNDMLEMATVASIPSTEPLNKIITKSRTKIVREPMLRKDFSNRESSRPLVKIGLRKLVRRNVVSTNNPPTPQPLAKPTMAAIPPSIVPSTAAGKYKIDRRRNIPLSSMCITKFRKKTFVARYALRRCSEAAASLKIKRLSIAKTSSRAVYKPQNTSYHNKLQMLNINGVLYKSTRNTLQRKDAHFTKKELLLKPSATPVLINKPGERAVFVRGNKFVLDKHGFKLTRVGSTRAHPGTRLNILKRIDIGGLTYVAKSNNILVRTENHLVRSHVCSAKQKSIHMLSRSLVKSNVPCAIFQRVGKCAAFERGKCMKVHDKMQVAICQKFLRGECPNVNCLLSHNVSLSKMPVCKFFLQGCCVRTDCPYLHKKLSQSTEICSDFLKGFCKLAQQCNKRHEFLCPEFESKGKCEKVKCGFCLSKIRREFGMRDKKKEKKQPHAKPPSIVTLESPVEPHNSSTRYFINASEQPAQTMGKDSCPLSVDIFADQESKSHENLSEEQDDLFVPKPSRPKLGDLPAFIPFK